MNNIYSKNENIKLIKYAFCIYYQFNFFVFGLYFI